MTVYGFGKRHEITCVYKNYVLLDGISPVETYSKVACSIHNAVVDYLLEVLVGLGVTIVVEVMTVVKVVTDVESLTDVEVVLAVEEALVVVEVVLVVEEALAEVDVDVGTTIVVLVVVDSGAVVEVVVEAEALVDVEAGAVADVDTAPVLLELSTAWHPLIHLAPSAPGMWIAGLTPCLR